MTVTVTVLRIVCGLTVIGLTDARGLSIHRGLLPNPCFFS